jgi:hypothetical protein
MKPKITLDNWRFEFLKDPRSSWNQLRVGGFIRPEDGSDSAKNGVSFVEAVTDLQGMNKQPQFTEGFELETESRIVVLGEKENWSA